MTAPQPIRVRRLSLRHGRVVALAAGLAAGIVSLQPLAAGADPLGSARARAAALARTVESLQLRAEVATERFDAAEAKLGQAVIQRSLAQQAADQAQSLTADDRAQVDDRVRALYMSGGAVSLFATVLDSPNFTDAMARYHDVGVLLSWDNLRVSGAQANAAKAEAVSARLAATAAEVTRLQVAASTAATEVRTLLADQQRALAAADTEVRSLLAQAQAEAQAAAARSFTAALLAAGGSLAATVAPDKVAGTVIAAARTKLGDPYLWGGTGPNAYDCSGLTQFAYSQAGIALPRVAADQYNVGRHIGLAELKPGDLLFWATDVNDPTTIHHVAIYLGAGLMLAAPHTGDVVRIQSVYLDGYIGATRPYEPV